MDGRRFDVIAKGWAAGASRRAALGGLVAAAAGALAARAGAAQELGFGPECAAACRAEFPGPGQRQERQRCASACVEAAQGAGEADCAAECRAEFPGRRQRGERRACVRACVEAATVGGGTGA